MPSLSTHWGAILQIQTQLRALVTAGKLSGLITDNIIAQPVPAYRAVEAGQKPPLPSIILSPQTEIEDPGDGTNQEDDITFPVLVEFLAANNQDLSASPDEFLSWREITAKAFRHQHLVLTDPVTDFFQLDIQYLPPFDYSAWVNPGLWAGALLLKPRTWQLRGIT